MLIKGLTFEQLQQAANAAKVRLSSGGSWGAREGDFKREGNYWRIVIRLIPRESRKVRAPWVRKSITFAQGRETRRKSLGVVCWHGHREFMRECFERNPEAIIKTSLITYRGSEDFERTHLDTGDRNVGSIYQPVYFSDCCYCYEERGIE